MKRLVGEKKSKEEVVGFELDQWGVWEAERDCKEITEWSEGEVEEDRKDSPLVSSFISFLHGETCVLDASISLS